MIGHVVERLAAERPDCLAEVFGEDVTFVPVPRSAPFPPRERNALWVPRRIAEVLLEKGLGSTLWPCLKRRTPVQKSAIAATGARPTPQEHLDSLEMTPAILTPARITLVDDVVTKGATLLAAAALVAETFPRAEIRAFALVRTRGLVADIDRIIDPVRGVIRLNRWGGADREP